MQVERIGITQNYNNSSRQNFTAKFSKKEIVSMAKNAKENYGAAGIPMLDILLGYLEKIEGKIAHIVTEKRKGRVGFMVENKALAIDNKIVRRDDEYTSKIDLLKDYLVGAPDFAINDHVRMPERIFENRWFEQGTRDEKALLKHAL